MGSRENYSGEQLCDAAAMATGLADFGASDFEVGLGLVCSGLNQHRVSDGGARMLADEATRYLVNRLRIVEHHNKHPELARAPIEQPVIILGLPRTGTTVLSYLLDQDPHRRTLLNWEASLSVPPPTTATLRTDQRCLDVLEFQRAVLPMLDPPPPHWEWADGPTECTFLIAQDFKSVMWETRVPNPAYREFIESCDMTSAYRYHRQVLQVLQSEAPGRWCLKMPAHAYFVDAVLAEYPDARIIWTHRDPVTATASFMNLASFAHGLSLGAPDIEWIVDTYPDRLVEQVRRPMQALSGRDIHHVHYSELMMDPLGVIGELYRWLGDPLDQTVRARMTAWLDADPLERSRQATYDLSDFGLTRNELVGRFGDYIDAYNVQLDEGPETFVTV